MCVSRNSIIPARKSAIDNKRNTSKSSLSFLQDSRREVRLATCVLFHLTVSVLGLLGGLKNSGSLLVLNAIAPVHKYWTTA